MNGPLCNQFYRKWPDLYVDMEGKYENELEGLAKAFGMEGDFPDLLLSWKNMIRTLYNDVHEYFCSVKGSIHI